MAISDLITKVIAEDKFSATFNAYNQKIDAADKSTSRLGAGLSKLSGAAIAITPIVAAGAAVAAYVDEAAAAQTANVNLISSVAAANREFGDSVGTVESWQKTVADAADELRLFSDKEVAGASSRLVDMTKRLGFTEEQMAVLLTRSGDLAAGKTDLNGAIERVTAAMRGEAESAEFLGLSLSETQVMAYAEAQGLVFAQLSDNEKAQLRYALFLQQTNELQGRAGVLAETTAGKQQALNAQLDNQSAAIGEQLVPLWEGYAEVVGLAAQESGEGVGLITQALATLLATLLTVGTGFVTFSSQALGALKVIGAGMQAIGHENPLDALNRAIEENRGNLAGFAEFISDIPGVFSDAKEQIISGWQEQASAAEEAAGRIGAASGEAAGAYDNEAIAARQAAEQIAAEYEKAQAQREKAAAQAARRIGDLEFDHAQRMARLQQEVAADIAEAASEAAEAREEAAQDLAQGLADIEADLAGDIASINSSLAQTLADLDQQRTGARRDRSRDIRDIERELAQELADLEYETGQERNEIATGLAEDRAKAQAKAEEKRLDLVADLESDRSGILAGLEKDRLKTQEDFAGRRLASEKAYQDALARINGDFENEFAEADPFRRQILEFNRTEQLKQLEAQQADEQQALQTQEQAALTALQQKADSEIAILEVQAAQELATLAARTAAELADLQTRADARLALLNEESARDRQRLLEDANFAREKANERYNDEVEQIARRKAAAEAEAAENRARREQEAAEARAALQAKNAEELAQINEQEQEKVQAANEQLERERQNYADRLAALQRDNAQTLGEVNAHLAEIERSEADSWGRRVEVANEAAEEIRRANEMTLSGPSSSGGGGGGVTGGFGGRGTAPVLVPSITINNNGGGPPGWAGGNQNANQIQQALMDTLNGGA